MESIEILGLGEVVVDWVAELPHFPSPDEKIDALSENFFPGGVTANYLVSVSRLNIRCGFIGAVGKDQYGDFLIDNFKKEHIDISQTLRLGNKKTPVNFIFIANGDKTIIQSPQMKTTKINISDLDENTIANANLLHTTLIHPDLAEKAFKIAKKNDVKISIDLESQIAKIGWDKLKKFLLQADVVLPNKEGAKRITGENIPEHAAQKLIQKGIPLVIITLGKEGALITTKNSQKKIPSYEVKKIIDTTGAGDTFNGAFSVAYWIKNWDVDKAVKYANAAAALKIQKLGAITGMPKEEELNEFLSRREPNFFNK